MKKIFVFMVTLCVACMSVVMPVSAGNGPNPHPTDSYAWIRILDGSSDTTTVIFSVPTPDLVSEMSGVSYDKASNTLTLNGLNAPTKTIITNEMGDDFTIRVTGTNHIQQIYAYGYGYGGSVALTGTGELIINENKLASTPIMLEAEGSNAKFKAASGLTLKAYNKSGYPAVYVDGSSASDGGIVFEGNTAMNNKVAVSEISESAYCRAYRTNETSQLYPCTPKDTSVYTGSYAAQKYLNNNDEEYYVICEIITDDEIGNIAIPATDDYGNPLPEEAFDISTDESNIEAVDATFADYLSMYTKTGDSAQYGCYHYSSTVNGVDLGEFYCMYRLTEITNGSFRALFAVPVENEQELKAMPEGYTAMEGSVHYSYTYDEAVNIGSTADPCAKGHQSVTTTAKATPDADGKIVNTCSVCKKTLSTTVIPKVATIKLSDTSYTYNGKAKTPSVTVKDSKGQSLTKNTDYTVSYDKGRKSVGQYKVTVTFTGNYSGTESLSFTITPKKTSLSSVKAKKKAIVIKWKKQTAQTTGYQLQYSTDKNFKKNTKTVTITKNKTTSKTISKLKAKKKYYVRIRTYKTARVNGKSKKIYSAWSGKKSVTTKK